MCLHHLSSCLGEISRLHALGSHTWVVDDQPGGNGAEPIEGAAVAAEPGRCRLTPDELDALVPGEARRHHEAPGAAHLAAGGIEQHRLGG